MEENRKTIRHHTKSSIGLFILLCLQMIVFLVVPEFLPNRFDPAEMTVVLTAIISVFAGASKNKIKWFFPIATALIIVVTNLFYNPKESLTYIISLYFAACSTIIIAASSALVYLCKKAKKYLCQKLKKRRNVA